MDKKNELTNNNITKPEYILKLYITGASANSTKAVSNLKNICEQYLKGRYTLDIIDIHQQPKLAKEAQVIALPLLIKHAPLPVKRLIGSMSDTSHVLKGLAIEDDNY